MARIQLVIVLALVAIIAAISIPRAIKLTRLTKAEHYALTISSAFQQYKIDTGKECESIENLLSENSVSGWLGPYVSQKVINNPWGGVFAVDQKSKKIGIPVGDKAPDQYEFGGSEEISFSYDST
jgi:type II secretory pathway pseudopilin PulG